jgi:hypothetical protein
LSPSARRWPSRRRMAGGGLLAAHIPAQGRCPTARLVHSPRRLRVHRCHSGGGLAVHLATCALAADWLTKSWIVGRLKGPRWRTAVQPRCGGDGCAHGERTSYLTAGQESHDRGAMREVDGIRILMFSSPWVSRSPVRNGFPNETLLGYQADEAGDHLHAIKRRPQGERVDIGIPARCGTGRACLTVSGLAVARIGLKPRPTVAVTP